MLELRFYSPNNDSLSDSLIHNSVCPLGSHVPRVGEMVVLPLEKLNGFKVEKVITAFGQGHQIIHIKLEYL